jgi:uncharacterized membrane protein YqjE
MAINGHREALRDQSVRDLVKELSGQVSLLVHQEVELAKAELEEKGKKAGIGAGMLGGAAVAALALVGSLTAFLILVIAIAIPAWASALCVTVLWAAVAAVLALRGRDELRRMGKPIPEKTVDTVKEDVQWLKDPTRSGTR